MAIAIVPYEAMAHQGGIQGMVSDSLSEEGIESVLVLLVHENKVTSTDLLGKFTFIDLSPGIYSIQFSMPGFAKKIVKVTVIENQTVQCRVQLKPIDIKLSEVVISQGKSINSTMMSLNKIDISLRPIRSSQDILMMIPGLVIAQHAGGGKAEQIFLRGFDIDHGTDIRLSLDGMPVNMVSHAHGQGYSDLHFITPELIDHVNFNKGPYYASQGDFTTAGYASFQTKNALDKNMVKVEGGRFDSYRVVGMIDLLDTKAKARNQSAFIASEYMYSNGYVESPQHFNRVNLTGKYHGAIGTNKILTATLSTFSSKWDASGQIPTRAVTEGLITRFGSLDNKEGGNTSRSNINVRLVKILPDGGAISQQLYASLYQFELYSNFTFFLRDSINGDQIRQKEKRMLYGSNTSYTRHTSLKSKPLKSEIGLQIRYDDIKDSELSHTAERKRIITPLSLGNIHQINMGAYISETLQLNQKLSLNASLRFDAFQFDYENELDTIYNRKVKEQHITSPKFTLQYDFANEFQVYVKGGSGFHSNDARVVVNESISKTLPRAIGFDVGIFYKPSEVIFINAAIWGLDLQQEFVYVGDEAIVEQSGYSRRYGFDFSLRYQLQTWLYLDSDINFTKPRSMENPEGQNYIPLAPTVTSIGGLTAKFVNGINISCRYRYVGDRPANAENTVIASGYKLLDAVISYNRPSFSIGLLMENILNDIWNEAQFDTTSKMKNETQPVSELHFTPGTPFFAKMNVAFYF